MKEKTKVLKKCPSGKMFFKTFCNDFVPDILSIFEFSEEMPEKVNLIPCTSVAAFDWFHPADFICI